MGLLDSFRDSWGHFADNVRYHPVQAGLSVLGGMFGGPIASKGAQLGFDAYNDAHGTSPDQLRAAEYADAVSGTGDSVNGADYAASQGYPGTDTAQMDSLLLDGYTPESSPTPGWYDNTSLGAADPLGVVPDYSGSSGGSGGGGSSGGSGAAGNNGGSMPGGGNMNVMNGASTSMMTDFAAPTNGDYMQRIQSQGGSAHTYQTAKKR